MSSLGVYSSDLLILRDGFAVGPGNHGGVAALRPGKERMRRLMSVLASGRVDLGAILTQRYRLDEAACELFTTQRDGVLKVVITP